MSSITAAAFPAIDRSISSSLTDAREALVNAVVDLISAYKSNMSNLQQQQSSLVVPASMRLFPVYILALLKQVRKTPLSHAHTHAHTHRCLSGTLHGARRVPSHPGCGQQHCVSCEV